MKVSIVGVIRGDTRSLDYSSHLVANGLIQPWRCFSVQSHQSTYLKKRFGSFTFLRA